MNYSCDFLGKCSNKKAVVSVGNLTGKKTGLANVVSPCQKRYYKLQNGDIIDTKTRVVLHRDALMELLI